MAYVEEQSRDLTNIHLAVLSKQLLELYRDSAFSQIFDILKELKEKNPMIFNHEFVKELHMNSLFKYGNQLMTEENFQEAKTVYEQLLESEHEYMLDNELILYEIYSKLADVYDKGREEDVSELYRKKAKQLIRKMMSAKDVQNLYLTMTTKESRDVINAAKRIDERMLDDYNRAKMNMVLGNAYFDIKQYKTAVGYLKAAIEYYEEKTYNSLTVLMYEELSKCYSNLEEHELAVKYMMKAKKSQEERHQIS